MTAPTRTAEHTGVDVSGPLWGRHSPSQLSRARRCMRQWWWEKIRKLRVPIPEWTQAAWSRGRLLHKEVETYLVEGAALGPRTSALAPFLPAGGSVPKARAEAEFRWADMWGYADLVEVGRVTDFKFWSRLPANNDLPDETDAQALVYCLAFRKSEFRWLYCDRIGRVLEHRVGYESLQAAAELYLDIWMPIVETMRHRSTETDPGKVGRNRDACGDWGGCRYYGACMTHGGRRSIFEGAWGDDI